MIAMVPGEDRVPWWLCVPCWNDGMPNKEQDDDDT